MSITSNILQRTFAIRSGEGHGTCFTIDLSNKRYLVTARHVWNKIRDDGKIEIWHDGRWKSFSVRLVGSGSGQVDVSVLAPDQLFGAPYPLLVSTKMIVTEDVYFLGFPHGLHGGLEHMNAQFPFPLVKKGIISAYWRKDGLVLLDGHNNSGFSGGPVVRGDEPRVRTHKDHIKSYK